MYPEVSTLNPTARQITLAVHQCLGRLLQKRRLDASAHDDFAAARGMLEALLLSTDQFGLACRRLRNAQHYLHYTEPGAAWYARRLLAGSLPRGEEAAREPRRRVRRWA